MTFSSIKWQSYPFCTIPKTSQFQKKAIFLLTVSSTNCVVEGAAQAEEADVTSILDLSHFILILRFYLQICKLKTFKTCSKWIVPLDRWWSHTRHRCMCSIHTVSQTQHSHSSATEENISSKPLGEPLTPPAWPFPGVIANSSNNVMNITSTISHE